MICIECGNISISKRCVSCVIRQREGLPPVQQQHMEPPVEVMLEPVVVEEISAEPPPPPRQPRPRWEPEIEVAEDPFAHKDLPRHYFQREGKRD